MIVRSPGKELSAKAQAYAAEAFAEDFGTSLKSGESAAKRLSDKQWHCCMNGDEIGGLLIYDPEKYRILLLKGDDASLTALLDDLKDLFSKECTARINVLSSRKDCSFSKHTDLRKPVKRRPI